MPPRRRLAQADANQVTAPTAVPRSRPRATVAPIGNAASAGAVGPSRSRPLVPSGGELARIGRDQKPTRGEAAGLDALRVQLGG